MKANRIARVAKLLTWIKMGFLDLGYILKEDLLEPDYRSDVSGEKNRVYVP